MGYDWNFGRLAPYWPAFLRGALVTVYLTSIVVVAGTLLGVVTGLLLRDKVLRLIISPMVDVLRALPPLVLLLFMYYFMTRQTIGVAVPAFWVSVVAMSLNLCAFTAELVRSAVDNVPGAYLDAGRALGMSHSQLTRHIVLPHVVRETLPSMTVLYIGMLKMSSLASVIAVRETVYAAQTVMATLARSLEAWVVVACIYVILVLPASHAARWLEWRLRRTVQHGGRL